MTLRWSVYLVNLEPVIGSEQGKTRPALIISDEQINEILPVVNILPITSKKGDRKIYPNEVLIPKGNGGLTNDSIILCYQIRTVDKKRLSKLIGTIEDVESRIKILDSLSFQLSIGDYTSIE